MKRIIDETTLGTYKYDDDFNVEITLTQLNEQEAFLAYVYEKNIRIKKAYFGQVVNETCPDLETFIELVECILECDNFREEYIEGFKGPCKGCELCH